MKRPDLLFLFVILFLTLFACHSNAQVNGNSTISDKNAAGAKMVKECPPKDIFDVILKSFSEKPDSNRRFSVFILPYIGYNPVTQIQFGAGGSLSWHLGDPRHTSLSAATVSAQVTTKKQIVLQAKSNIYTRGNQWFLQGDWRYYFFNLATYGLGTMNGYNIPPVQGVQVNQQEEEATNGVFGMDYNWVKFHQVFSRKITNNLYAGVGYHLDYHYQIKDTQLQLDTPDVVMTPHYAYCQIHGFNQYKYTSSGFSLNCVYDTRDNIINPYKGFYVNANYRYNFQWIGSDASGSQLWTEFRTYVGLSKRLPRHLLAFWFYGSFVLSGVIPYLDLPATGFDQMNSSGRGYNQGRWRGEDFIYGEIEYRFPISQCSQILGGVLFVNATTASNQDMDIFLFDAVRPAIGAGLRIMVSKRNRINILIDFAIGQKSNGFYIQAQEAF
jgi:hypothetical protein